MIEPPETVAKIRKNTTEEIRIVLNQYGWWHLASVAVWEAGPGGHMMPTGRGFNVQVARLPDLIAGLTAAAEAAKAKWPKKTRQRARAAT